MISSKIYTWLSEQLLLMTVNTVSPPLEKLPLSMDSIAAIFSHCCSFFTILIYCLPPTWECELSEGMPCPSLTAESTVCELRIDLQVLKWTGKANVLCLKVLQNFYTSYDTYRVPFFSLVSKLEFYRHGSLQRQEWIWRERSETPYPKEKTSLPYPPPWESRTL